MIAVPDCMAHLPRDRRGYPIPAIVLMTSDGKPHFTINDDRKVHQAAMRKLCGICGKRLRKGEHWFVGGPASAFHPRGAYLDGPVHHECGTFAMQACPYLAAPVYSGRIDERTLNAEQRAEAGVLINATVLPARPDVFIFGRATDYKFFRAHAGSSLTFLPRKPFVEYEFWQKGVQLSEEVAAPLIAKALATLA